MKTVRKLTRLLLSGGLVGCLAASATAANWPQWHGPTRDNISRERALLKQWPKGGPKLLWRTMGCGNGFSSVSIVDGMIYTAGTFGDQTFVLALDLDGKPRWKGVNSRRWTTPRSVAWAENYDGARATPTVNDGLVYHLSERGRLAAFHSKTGKEAWAIDITNVFRAKMPLWGYSESVLIDGGHVICCPGGRKGFMAALDKKTGKTAWASIDVGDPPSYSSPILVEDHGVRQIITMSATAVLAVNADTGKLLWRRRHINTHKDNAATPTYHSGLVHVSSGYRRGSEVLKLTFGQDQINAERAWTNREMDSLHGGVILLDGHLYGGGDRRRGLLCLDFETGKKLYRDNRLRAGSLTCADGMLYCLGERGQMTLVKPSPKACQVLGQFLVPRGGRGPYWAHPVVCDGRLYVRHASDLYAYDVKAR